MDKYIVQFEDECPRIGQGMRIVSAKIGWKWVHMRDAMGRRARIRRALWDELKPKPH